MKTQSLLIEDKQLKAKLACHERDIVKLMRQGKEVLFKLSHELYLARNTCLEHDSEGTFGKWVERFNMSRTGAYRAIARWEALAPKILGTPTTGNDCPKLGQSPPFEGFLCFAQFDDSAIDELAKSSTPPKALNAAVKIAQSGGGMTRKDAIGLIEKHAKPPTPKPPKPKPAPPETDEPIEADSEPVNVSDGTWEPILPGHREPETPKRNGKPPKQYPGSHWFKQYQQAIGPLCRIVDKIAEGFGDSPTGSQKVVQDHLQVATEEMEEWLGLVPK